ncbi:hypothetical protein GQX74_002439 [Glossina fuscipes]|nr:hypothetical protein GQX74_002439 [Glossina fuscipes]
MNSQEEEVVAVVADRWGFQAFTSVLLLPLASPAALSACSCGSSRSSPISKAAAKHCIATSALSWASALKALSTVAIPLGV